MDNKSKEKPEDKKSNSLYHTKKEPKKSLQSYLRNQNKMMTSTVAIVDRKAMILIRINTLLLTSLIVFQDFIMKNVEQGSLIAILLVVGCLGSLTFAILTVKPFGQKFKKLFDKKINSKYKKLEDNNFFLLETVSIEDYEKSMSEVVKSQELQIGNQVRFNYALNMIINKKYLLIGKAYNIFLISFILVVLVYFVSKFVS